MKFPTPVGGTALPIDFIPSVIFAALYGALLPLLVFRAIDKRSRSIVLISTMTFTVERIVIYSLRAAQARGGNLRTSSGLLTYLQISLAMGFITLSNDLVNVLRCLFVNTTFSQSMYEQSPAAQDAPLHAMHNTSAHSVLFGNSLFKGWQRERFTGQPEEGDPDHPKRRIWFRAGQSILSLLFLAAIIPSAVAHQNFGKLPTDQSFASRVFKLRYAGDSVALFFNMIIAAATAWGYAMLPRVRAKAVGVTLAVCTLTSVIAVYRLSVMHNETTSLLSNGHNTLNSTGAKAGFYVLHALPEWLAAVLLFSVNLRQLFGTGPWGDWRNADETEKERKKRLEKEEKRARKKLEKSMGAN